MTSLGDLKIPLYPQVNGVPRAPTTSRAANATWLMQRINQLIDQLIVDFDLIELEAGGADPAEITALRNRLQDAEQLLSGLSLQFGTFQGAEAAQTARLDSLESTNSSQSQAISNQGQQIAAHAVQLSGLESENQAQDLTISVLETASVAVSEAINALQVGASAASQRLTTLETTTTSQGQTLSSYAGQITALQAAQSGLQQAITALQVDDGNDDQRLATLETTTTGQAAQIAALQAADSASAAFLALGPSGAVDTVDLVKGQMRFPTTPKPSTNARTLDDYLEFDWTPDIRFGGNAAGVTYGSRVGKGIKIGRMVFLSWSVTLTSKGTSTGNCQINGSPYSADAVAALQAGFHNTTQIFFRVNAGASSIDLLTTANAAITNTTLVNTSTLNGSLTFITGS